MVELRPSTLTTAERRVTSSRAASYRAPFLIFLTAYLVIFMFIWFLVEIIIHSEPQASPDNVYYVQITLAEMSLQLFMYCCILVLVALSLAWYADLQRTKAARAAAAMVGTFSKSVWLYTLWYSISTFYKGYNNLNWFCGGGTGSTSEYPGVTDSKSDWCYLARTVAVLNVLIGAGLIALWVWCVINRFARITPEIPISTTVNVLPAHNKAASNANNAAHNMDISWRTVLTLPDDLEQAFIAAAHPDIYGPMRSRMNFLSKVGTTLLVIISIGSLLMTYPSISYSKSQGLNSWSTSSYTSNTTKDYVGWGDPIIAGNWYWLMLTLGASLAMTSYADGRTHRSFAAAACCLSTLSVLQILSFWVYSARRVNATAGSFITTSLLDSNHAQDAEIGGAGLVMLCQVGISFTLLVRYFTWLPITPEHLAQYRHPAHINGPSEIHVVRDTSTDPNTSFDRNGNFPSEETMYVPGPQRSKGGMGDVPSYNLPALHGVGIVLRLLIGFEVLLLFTWWIVQVVSTAEDGVFNNATDAMSYFFNERMFILTSVLCTASLFAAIYGERHRDSGSTSAACVVCANMLAGFFLLVWPFAYQSLASDGYLRTSACVAEFWCHVTKASGVFAMLQGFLLFFALLSSVFTVSRIAGEDRGEIAGGRRLSSLLSGSLVWLLQVFVWVWALVTLAATVRFNLIGSYQQWQYIELLPGATYSGLPGPAPGNAFTEGYWSSQAFLLLVIIAAVSWLLCWTRTPFEWQSRATRVLTTGACFILFASTFPMLIFACRFAQTLALNSDERTFVAAFILLPVTAMAILAVALWRFGEPLYRNPNPVLAGATSSEMLVTDGTVNGQNGLGNAKLVSVVTIPSSLHTEQTLNSVHQQE